MTDTVDALTELVLIPTWSFVFKCRSQVSAIARVTGTLRNPRVSAWSLRQLVRAVPVTLLSATLLSVTLPSVTLSSSPSPAKK